MKTLHHKETTDPNCMSITQKFCLCIAKEHLMEKVSNNMDNAVCRGRLVEVWGEGVES